MDYCVDTLRMPLPRQKSEAFPAVLRAKSHASNTVLTLAARINDADLKRQTLDKLSELVEIIKQEDRKLIGG
jgi:hypothetical protein